MIEIHKLSENKYCLIADAIDPSVEILISSGGDDGYVLGASTNYSSAHDNAVGAEDDLTFLRIGQVYEVRYTVYRTFLKFDTTSIPSNAIITEAQLKLYGTADNSTTDFYIRLQKWTGDTPIDTGDYNQFDGINYDDGTFNTINFVVNSYNTINISNFNLIQKGGYTKICVRSNRDIDSIAPTTGEFVEVSSYEGGNSPKLYIVYTVPAPPKHPTTHLDKGPHPRSRMAFYPRLSL